MHGPHQTPFTKLGGAKTEVFSLQNGAYVAKKEEAKQVVELIRADYPNAYVNWMPTVPGNKGQGKGYLLVVADGADAQKFKSLNKGAVRKVLFPEETGLMQKIGTKSAKAPLGAAKTMTKRLVDANGQPIARAEAIQIAARIQEKLPNAVVKPIPVDHTGEDHYLLVATGNDAEQAKRFKAPGMLRKFFGLFEKDPKEAKQASVETIEQTVLKKFGVLA